MGIKLLLLAFAACLPIGLMSQNRDTNADTLSVVSKQNVDSLSPNKGGNANEGTTTIEVSTKMSETDSLKQVIAYLETENAKLKRQLVFADSCFLRVSNDCFRKPYSKERVDIAINNFSKMYSKTLQESFSPLKTLLEGYDKYYQELMTTFALVENVRMDNLFKLEKVKGECIKKIKSTEYCRKVYSANWTIMFLNNAVDEAINRIKNYDPRKFKLKPIKLVELLK